MDGGSLAARILQQPATVSDDDGSDGKRTLYVGQPHNVFCVGARFDGISRMKIHPPPPGCAPNEYQTMLMNNSGQILFSPSPERQTRRSQRKNRVTPNVTAVVDINILSDHGNK